MEIITNKLNEERALVRVNFEKVRVLGDSKSTRRKKNRIGNTVVFAFNGGPFFNVGGSFYFEKMKYKILGIDELKSKEDTKEIVLKLVPNY